MGDKNLNETGGLLVGKTDKQNGKGIEIIAPEGKIVAGGGEIVVNEAASTLHCEELSKINQSTGGVAIPCDAQKTANKGPMKDGGKINSDLTSHLSGEHKDAMEMAHNLLNSGSVEKNADIIVKAWRNSLLPHFKEEESQIYNVRMDDESKYFISEHKVIQSLVEKIASEPNQNDINEFAYTLIDHINDEEEYFYKDGKESDGITEMKGGGKMPGEKTFKERINVEKNSENFKDIRQSLDEFFTPKWVAEIMFDLALKHGFKGGSILEPSFGHGVFFDVAIENESKTELGINERDLYGFEIYKPNYDFVKNNYPGANLFDHNFEYQFIDKEIFFKKNKIEKSLKFENKQFDLCIGNPPYGAHKSPHAYYFNNQLQIRYEGFFIYLALKKLKKGGLLVFIINSLWLQNNNLYNKQKEEIAKYGDLIDAYRLPNKTFEDTDIATDIVIFKRK